MIKAMRPSRLVKLYPDPPILIIVDKDLSVNKRIKCIRAVRKNQIPNSPRHLQGLTRGSALLVGVFILVSGPIIIIKNKRKNEVLAKALAHSKSNK